MKMTTITIN